MCLQQGMFSFVHGVSPGTLPLNNDMVNLSKVISEQTCFKKKGPPVNYSTTHLGRSVVYTCVYIYIHIHIPQNGDHCKRASC